MHCSLAVQSDRRLLRRLLQNLVSNAIKYTPRGTRAGRLPAATASAAHRRLRHRARHSRVQTTGDLPGISPARSGRQGGARARARAFDRGADRARAQSQGRGQFDVDRGSHFSIEVPLASAVPLREPRAHGLRHRSADSSPASRSCASTTTPRSSTAWRWCSPAGAAACSRRRTRDGDRGDRRDRTSRPRVLLIDYHLDDGNGIEAIMELRRRYGADLTAILITADRSPDVREEARAHGVLLLNKPVKPAALRALITQVRIKRAVAAE